MGCSLSKSEKIIIGSSFNSYLSLHDSVWAINSTNGNLIGAWYYSFNNGASLFRNASSNTAIMLDDDKTIVAAFNIKSSASSVLFFLDISTTPANITFSK